MLYTAVYIERMRLEIVACVVVTIVEFLVYKARVKLTKFNHFSCSQGVLQKLCIIKANLLCYFVSLVDKPKITIK